MVTHYSSDKEHDRSKAEERKPVTEQPDQTPEPEMKEEIRKPKVEKLPLGTGYEVEHLPTEVIRPEIKPVKQPLPDLVRSKELETCLSEEPVPSPEDEFYDFEKDIYGDEVEIRPDL
ncbi:hypothetical protein [Proteiniclasticum sp. QWL-01]|uniref:hypothetical protein n=1 Tax=Proteiniclasticum sp. QWL-01 TaxID=3036945 RepID=UPI0021FB4CFD|nr:hypothetical protein [Proteiniclasticum sp. QWL-01]UUM12341.1 hypothetical protein NQU17_01935 [Clostridiaceae bacterium HFYG-1003]WFF73871.1 hypothetical protein P6M73_05335 [Proteiniclasticum sp. QWL-01]